MRFQTTTYNDPMEVLTKLRQTSIVAFYKAEFEAVFNRIKGLSPLHKLSYFLSGLKDKIRLPVRMLNPQSLNKAFGFKKNMCGAARRALDTNKNQVKLPFLVCLRVMQC